MSTGKRIFVLLVFAFFERGVGIFSANRTAAINLIFGGGGGMDVSDKCRYMQFAMYGV